MNCPYCIKICSKCGKLLVAYNGNFGKQKRGKYGLRRICKRCMNIKSKEWRKNNKEHIKEKSKEWRENNKEYRKEWRENNKEHIKEYNKEHNKEWRKNNKEHIKEKSKEWRENNKEYIKEKNKEWYENNKEYRKEYNKEWCENNPDKTFNYNQKRRLKEENQGKGITKDQWLEMMEFFDWKCAYSGITLDKNNRSIDHIVALNNNGEHEIWNCIPMYMPYNSSKNTNNMLEWYQKQDFFSEERLNKIYEWIEYAKNKWENSNK